MPLRFAIFLTAFLLVAVPGGAEWKSILPPPPVALDQSAPPIEEDLPEPPPRITAPSNFATDLQSLSGAPPAVKRTYRSLDPAAKPKAPLPEREMEFAATAWSYFEATTDEKTGLVRSTLKFPSTTMWDQGGYFLALVSAQKLGLISRETAIERAERALKSLGQMPLNKGMFPNKAYNTETLQMTDYANKVLPHGIGYSALDIMRLISGMLALEQTYPEIAELSQRVRGGWPLEKLVLRGRYYSTTTVGSHAKGLQQEGRIGYEQYAGRVGLQIGLNVWEAVAFAPITRWQEYEGLQLPGDNRLKETHGVDPVTTSEPFILEALEFGWRPELSQVTTAVFLAQLRRYEITGNLTSLSEDHIAGAPYFAYGGILVGQTPFQTITPGRKVVNDKRRISTKGSFGWWVLTKHPYGDQLLEAVADLQTETGWQAGRFEADMSANTIVTLNTNAVVLQALHFKAFGPLIQDAYSGFFQMRSGSGN